MLHAVLPAHDVESGSPAIIPNSNFTRLQLTLSKEFLSVDAYRSNALPYVVATQTIFCYNLLQVANTASHTVDSICTSIPLTLGMK